MTTQDHPPHTLLEATRYFADPAVCDSYLKAKCWPEGVACPYCGNRKLGYVSTVRLWRCAPCKKRFSVKVGTIFEASPLPLSKWLPCVWMIVNAKNGVSSCEIARSLGVTQKTGWFMLHRVREALRVGSFEKMKGVVEADETFVGGLAKNMHKGKRAQKIKGTGEAGKSIVMGLLERTEKAKRVHAKVVKDVSTPTLKRVIDTNVEKGSTLHTDAYRSYRPLGRDYVHRVVDHAIEYVNNSVSTNGLENFWSLLKRTIKGTYVHVDAAQLQAYLDEQAWRFNECRSTDGERFATVAGMVSGRRLTYKRLISRRLAPLGA